MHSPKILMLQHSDRISVVSSQYPICHTFYSKAISAVLPELYESVNDILDRENNVELIITNHCIKVSLHYVRPKSL